MASRHSVNRYVGGSTIYCGLIRRMTGGEAWLSEVYAKWYMRFLNLATGKDLNVFYFLGPKYNRHRSMSISIRGNNTLAVDPSPMANRYPWPAAPAATFAHNFSTVAWHGFEAWERVGVTGELGVKVDGELAYLWNGDTSIPVILNPDGETYTGAQGIDLGILRQRDSANIYTLLMDDVFIGPIPVRSHMVTVNASSQSGGKLRRVG